MQIHRFDQRSWKALGYVAVTGLAMFVSRLENAQAREAIEQAVNFSRDVRPILSDQCFQCHGPAPDSRKADLRLDKATSATRDRGGYAAVVAGDAVNSEVIRRILSEDVSEVMPPPESGKSLTADEIEMLQRWISQGAEWSGHWAFVAPVRPVIPKSGDAPADWKRSPIDQLVLNRMRAEGLNPSARASRDTLLRRLHLDLIGLPPTPKERNEFLQGNRADAYRSAVERLLASPHYGERWGRHWLDAARYADSDGYEKDMRRSNWFYRDWVIHAINADMPYDEFIIKQIAGDLLPGAGQAEKVATGFLRNSMVNEEGGADPEQFRVEGIFDRIDAIGKAVLGMTTQCAQCHTHKFDPLTHEDYFGLFAYLNSSNESTIAAYTLAERQTIQSIHNQIDEQEQELRDALPGWKEALKHWAVEQRQLKFEWQSLPVQREDYTGQKFEFMEDGSILSQSFAPPKETNGFIAELPEGRVTAIRLELLTHPDLPRNGPGRSIFGTNALTEFEVAMIDAEGNQQQVDIATATADVNVDPRPLGHPFVDDHNGPDNRTVGPVGFAIDNDPKTAWTTNTGPASSNQPRKAVFVLADPIERDSATKLVIRLNQRHGGRYGNQRHTNIGGRFRFSWTDRTDPVADPLPAAVRKIVSRDVENWSNSDWRTVFTYWRTTRPEWDAANKRMARLLINYPIGTNQYVITERTTPRITHRMERGDFLSPQEVVQPHLPNFLHPQVENTRPDRLGLARWLVDRRSPTTARALVNRVWQEYFGTGLVETTEDLGSQSPPASHPDLLDWLAVEFMDSGWSLKHLHRLIVNSATYQQKSISRATQYEVDPYNRLLSRGPRVRVPAEIVRDIALAASGLLNRQVGGPSVYPPAPRFLFLPPASYGEKEWSTADSASSHRRSLYVQMYRSVPYPPMQVFDAPNGNASCVRRARSNTPLQALTLLNETQFVQCAQAMSERLLAANYESDMDRIAGAYSLLLCREPTRNEMKKLSEFLTDCRERIRSGQVDAAAIAGQEDGTAGPAEELAAWTLVTRCLLNLDETITKQ